MFEIDKHKFGSFVAQLRKEKGYTQKELAERLFLSDKAISKWETGVSIPDTALLIPLSEILDVTVTELLLCQRTEPSNAMDSQKIEDIVKTAIVYSKETPARAHQAKGPWAVVYVLSLLLGGVGLFLCRHWGRLSEIPLVSCLLGAIFGAYFCFFARLKLPAYYDENKINGMVDGPFRMNVPGLSFNNSNWPHIMGVGRIWSCLVTGLYPLLSAIMLYSFASIWLGIELYVYLFLVLGGLFIPVYVVGKKYQ